MADPAWLEKSSLIADLAQSPGRFAYFQAIKLLILTRGLDFLKPTDFLETGLNIRASSTLAFAGSDLVEFKANDPSSPSAALYNLTVSFFGLYGAASPLPPLYGRTVLTEALADGQAIREFLDLLAAPFYRLHVLAHFHNQLSARLSELEDPAGLNILRGLMGWAPDSGPDDVRPIDVRPLGQRANGLRLEGLRPGGLALWARRLRPAAGLKIFLESSLGLEVTLEPFAPRSVPIPLEAKVRLGEPTSPKLGEGVIIGSYVLDIRTKFNLRLQPPDPETYRQLLPGGAKRALAESLIQAYAQEPLAYEFILKYRPGVKEALSLGQERGLGLETFLAPRAAETLTVYSAATPSDPVRDLEDDPFLSSLGRPPKAASAPNSGLRS
ncbi:MAG: type VI secretion system baseplate subunit TssG [Deltaproteobacteria bacterium]|jgi:type VI secretion system protein ImpH|nr:type VI secretion system baseplate subunit TssG [Deltaproteobacteria bacterium]